MGWPAAESAQQGLTLSCVLLSNLCDALPPEEVDESSVHQRRRHTAVCGTGGQSQRWLVDKQPLLIKIIKLVVSHGAGGTRRCGSGTYVCSVHQLYTHG